MPLPFSAFTSLLEKLEDVETRHLTLLPADKAKRLRSETELWFKKHRGQIHGLGVDEAIALLSSLLPERRTDRVYNIQALSLCRILSRALRLSANRAKNLQAYKQAGGGDLGQCVERILKAGGPPARPHVLLIEVDEVLLKLAEQCRFSDGPIKAKLPSGSSEERDKLIGDLVNRMHPHEGKWLVRLILKDFAPVRANESLVLKLFHFLLPDLLRFQNNFDVVVRLLKESKLRELPEQPDPRSEKRFREQANSFLRPLVGVKIGRPEFAKARSIDHCLKMVGGSRWVVERKYDGEYCEVHIDLRRSSTPIECLQIFSKSGKDSTADRGGIHQTLVDFLRLGKSDCKIKEQAVLLGELVVHSDETNSVLGFDQIRKHVSSLARTSGCRAPSTSRLGAGRDTMLGTKDGEEVETLEREGTVTPKSRRTKTPSTAKGSTTSVGSALEGTTLDGETSHGKRVRTDDNKTPCPHAKRHCLMFGQGDATKTRTSTTPLSDITNRVAQRDNVPPVEQPQSDRANFVGAAESAAAPCTSKKSCFGSICPFSNATVYFAPCVANTPYLIEDLVPTHCAELTHDISHWDRDSFAHARMTDTVSESQSHSGLHKIVVVEMKRPQAVNRILRRMTALNGSRFKERIEVYDWRVLEECIRHDRRPELLKRHFIGATIWDEVQEKTVFVSTIPSIGGQ